MKNTNNTYEATSERILIRASDDVKIINLGIKLPGHTKKELDVLKSSIKKYGVQIPILVKKGPYKGCYVIIDGAHRLQICRELGIDCPAILIDVDDKRAREICVEKNLSMRAMTKIQKKEMAFQLFYVLKLSIPKIAQRLCLSHTTVGKWLSPDKPDAQTGKQKVYKFFEKKHVNAIKMLESIKEFMAESRSEVEDNRDIAEEGMCGLKEVLEKTLDLLTEEIEKLRTPQQEINDENETPQPDAVEGSNTKLNFDKVY